jgi:hypothetical protein
MGRLSDEVVLAGLRAAAYIKSGQLPTEADLENAPRLTAWGFSPRENVGVRRLVGIVAGHPTIPDGPCVTSAVLIMDKDLRWARTVSRISLWEPVCVTS